MSTYQHYAVRPWRRTQYLNRLIDQLGGLRPWARRLAYVTAAAYAIVLIVQLAYPRDRTLPFMYAGLGLAGVTAEEVAVQLQSLNEARNQVGIFGTSAAIDIPAAQQHLLDYSWSERLVPFSLLDRAGTDLPASLPVNVVQPVAAVASTPEPAPTNNQFLVTNQSITDLIQRWLSENPGLKASVSFQELTSTAVPGTARQASVNGDMLMDSASVYKIYLAAFALKQVEAGTLNAATSIINGRDVNKCIEVMIVNSDNACGEALGSRLGWTKLNNYTRSLGLTATRMNIAPLQSSANDSVKFLAQLNSGSLLSKANTDLLLGYMGRQTYRKGIPAGATGATVYDKPGWNPSILNDVAIVRSPDADYLLAIYTNSNTAKPLQDLANRIQTLLGS